MAAPYTPMPVAEANLNEFYHMEAVGPSGAVNVLAGQNAAASVVAAPAVAIQEEVTGLTPASRSMLTWALVIAAVIGIIFIAVSKKLSMGSKAILIVLVIILLAVLLVVINKKTNIHGVETTLA